MKVYKKFIVYALMGFFVSISSIAIINYIGDPMHFYKFDPHKRFYFNPQMISYTEKWQGYGIVHSYNYELMVTGSSIGNYPLKYVEEIYGKKSICIAMLGTNFHENSLVINFSKAKYIVWACLQKFLEDDQIHDDFPVLFYLKSPLKDFSYLLKLDVLQASLENLFDLTKGTLKKANIYDFRYPFHKLYPNRKLYKFHQEKKKEKYHIDVKKRILMFEKYILQTIQHTTDKSFDIIIPPCSILFYKMLFDQGEFENYMIVRKHIINQLMYFTNVRVFDMESDTSLIKNFDCFIDWWHHNDLIYKKILHFIKIKKNLVTKHNIESYHQTFKESVENFRMSDLKKDA